MAGLSTSYNSVGVGSVAPQVNTNNYRPLSQAGYDWKLPGLGLSEPWGTAYAAERTPDAVYSGNVPSNQGTQQYQTPAGPTLPTNNNYSPGPSYNSYQKQNFSLGGSNADLYAKYGYDPTSMDINSPQFAALRNEIATRSQTDQQAQYAQLQDQVNQAYAPAAQYYDQIYNDTVAGKQNYLNQYSGLYDAQRPGLDAAYQSGVQQNQGQQQQVQQQETSAIDSARRLFNELQQGVQQRFGGSNSAGEFANAFYGRQLQQNMGNIQNTTGQNVKSLMDQATSLKTQYDANVKELETRKASALAQAQDSFQQRLDSINAARGELEQNKAQLKLQALQDYKNTINQVTMNAQNFAQSLYAAQQQQSAQLANTIAAYQTYSGQPVNLSSIGQLQYNQMGTGGGFQSASPTGYLSYMNPEDTKRKLL